MTWNYRILCHRTKQPHIGECDWFTIGEVYYNDAGNIESWADEIHPGGDTVDEMRADLDLMLAAFDEPILQEADLP